MYTALPRDDDLRKLQPRGQTSPNQALDTLRFVRPPINSFDALPQCLSLAPGLWPHLSTMGEESVTSMLSCAQAEKAQMSFTNATAIAKEKSVRHLLQWLVLAGPYYSAYILQEYTILAPVR